MYTVSVDGLTIHNPALGDSSVLIDGGVVNQQANRASEFTFTIWPANRGYGKINTLASVIEVFLDRELIFRGRPVQCRDGWENQKSFTCESGFAFFNDTIQRPYEYAGSVRGFIQKIITDHNSQVPAAKQFSLRTVTVTDPNDTIVRSNSDYVSTMQELQEKLVEKLGGFLIAEYSGGRWYLDYLKESPGATGQKIVLSKNLLDFIREQNAENIATALIPLGAKMEESEERVTIKSVNNGMDYITDADAAARYGTIFTTVIWDDVTTPSSLMKKAKAKLAEYTTLISTITLTAVDLSIIDTSIDPIRLLDYVTVEDDAHTASGRYLVTERTYNLSDPGKDRVSFGGEQRAAVSGKTSKIISDRETLESVILKNARQNARAILENSTDGNLYFRYNEAGKIYELDILNTDSPETATRLWRWNMGGLGYSGDGGKTYETAITMDGAIVANFITTGTLDADRVNVVNLKAQNIEVSSTMTLSDELEDHESKLVNYDARISANAQGLSSKVSASDYTGQYIVESLINQTASSVKIAAKNINLSGFISANNTFTVDESGSITATGGSIGGWTIGPTALLKERESSDTGRTYQAVIGAPSSPSDNSVAFAVRYRAASTDNWSYPFVVKYDGSVTATSGTIAGWTINPTNLAKVTTATISDNYYQALVSSPSNPSATSVAFAVRHSSSSSMSSPTYDFYVRYDGKLFANNAEITGKVTATSGEIGGITFSNNNLVVPASHIGNLSADKITSGTISADRISTDLLRTDDLSSTLSSLTMATMGSVTVNNYLSVSGALVIPAYISVNNTNGTTTNRYPRWTALNITSSTTWANLRDQLIGCSILVGKASW